jgi:hypothetical protein
MSNHMTDTSNQQCLLRCAGTLQPLHWGWQLLQLLLQLLCQLLHMLHTLLLCELLQLGSPLLARC